MAAPAAAGIIALWLEARPNLTVEDIKAILDNTAIHDSFTGNINDNTWGRGKIDAWLAMFIIEQSLGTDENKTLKKVIVYPNPTCDFITILTTENYANIKLFNALGQQINNLSVKSNNKGYTINLKNLNSGIYYLLLMNGQEIKNIKVIRE